MLSINLLLNKDASIKEIIEDVANLLSSRPQGSFFHKGETSILDYGMPDLSYYSTYAIEDQKTVAKLIEKSLKAFEPRLSNVVVTPTASEDKFHFRIQAKVGAKAVSLHLSKEGAELIE
jgi:type VI secretion system lysozyme-like protein